MYRCIDGQAVKSLTLRDLEGAGDLHVFSSHVVRVPKSETLGEVFVRVVRFCRVQIWTIRGRGRKALRRTTGVPIVDRRNPSPLWPAYRPDPDDPRSDEGRLPGVPSRHPEDVVARGPTPAPPS